MNREKFIGISLIAELKELTEKGHYGYSYDSREQIMDFAKIK